MEKLAYCQSSVDDDDSRRVLLSDPALFELLDKKIAEVSAQISQLKTINYYDYPKALDPKLDPLYNPPELVAKVLNERKRLFAKRPDDDTSIPPLDIYITAEQLLNFCEEEEEKGEQLVAITRPPNRRSNICTTPEHDQDMDTDCEYSVSDDEDIYDLEDEEEEKTLPAFVPAPAYTPPPPLPPLTPLGLADIELMCPSIKGLHWQSVIF